MPGVLYNGGYTLPDGNEHAVAFNGQTESVIVKAAKANSGTFYIGKTGLAASSGAADSGFPLEPGEWISVDLFNAQQLFVRGTSGDKLAFLETGP